MQQFAKRYRRQFFTSPCGSGQKNLTGIFINPNTIEILGAYELSKASNHKGYATDIRVKTLSGDHVIFQNLYLPSSKKDLHVPIIEEIQFGYEDLKQQHTSLQLFYGGDFNNSVENTPDKEVAGVFSLGELNRVCKSEDISNYDDTISITPTNRAYSSKKASSCRRLDRFYAPKTWKQKAIRFQSIDHKEITSSHNLIAVKYFQGTNSDVQLGKPRFQFPLRRLHPPFNRARTWNIPSDASIEEAINSIQSDGQEYIELVGYLRKNDPQYLQYLLADGQDQSLGGPHYKAARMFFQSKKSEKVVFKTLTNNVLNKEANTTPSMVKLATDYYKELYSSPPLANWNELRRYLKPLKTRTTRRQRDELGKPFTQSELEYALESMDKSTAPGPDGIQYSVLQYYWANIGPSLTRAANDMMDTGDLPQGSKKRC
ncbi:hypothetical protein JCM33374_g2829 [Metschnikowia sp. JCM 33374]|nr:hypothetical protein JCM33374_g2829 [Metschnikowia sp. JCM 33374]